MATYQFIPKIKLEVTAQEWRIEKLDNADNLAVLMSEKISFLIQDGWQQISNGKSFSNIYQIIEIEFEKLHAKHLNISDVDCMKVFYKLLDNFFAKEMVERVQNTNLLKLKGQLKEV